MTLEEEFEEKFPRFQGVGAPFPIFKDTPNYNHILQFVSSREEKAREEGRKEERQFILNILDGIDIADKEMGVVGGTQAIRLALQSRII